MHIPNKFFISGTDTDVGKTMVSAILALGLRATYWKPIQCGNEPSSDSQWLKSVGVDETHILPERYKLKNPLSPHRAAELEGVSISLDDFELPKVETEYLIVEGAGGLMVPLNSKDMVIDLAAKLQLPLLLVARSGLGTINHTVLSVMALQQKNIPLIGVVMNGEPNPANKAAIEHYGKTTVLAEIPTIANINSDGLLNAFQSSFGTKLNRASATI
jgi:dethiobiotin synthetase